MQFAFLSEVLLLLEKKKPDYNVTSLWNKPDALHIAAKGIEEIKH